MNDEKLKATAADTLTHYLEARKLRKTPERYAVLDMVLAMTGHFAAEAIVERMAEAKLSVSRGTVYKTMALLADCGLVRCHRFADRTSQYEVVKRGKACHLHLVCSRCGKVREVNDAEIERIVKSRRYETFHPEHFALSIYGICSRCQRKGRRAAHK